MSGSAFRVESDEGREVILEVVPAMLHAEMPIEFELEFGSELPKLRLRMSNDEAAELLEMLDGEIGEWARERGAARRAFDAGAGRADFNLHHPDPGLDALDPKHPDYVENLAAYGDARRKEARESPDG